MKPFLSFFFESDPDALIIPAVAAFLTSTVSIITLIVTVVTNHRLHKMNGIRDANRKMLDGQIELLADNLHQINAITKILLKPKTEASDGNWRKRLKQACIGLKQMRIKVKYPLWGIFDALRELGRVSDYIDHTFNIPTERKKITRRSLRLGNTVDACIRKCYMYGRSPNWCERKIIKYRRKRLHRQFKKSLSRKIAFRNQKNNIILL